MKTPQELENIVPAKRPTPPRPEADVTRFSNEGDGRPFIILWVILILVGTAVGILLILR